MIKIERDLDPIVSIATFECSYLFENNKDALKIKNKLKKAEEELFELVVKQLKEQNFEFDEGQIIYVSKYNFKILYFNGTFLLMDSTYNKNNYLEVKI